MTFRRRIVNSQDGEMYVMTRRVEKSHFFVSSFPVFFSFLFFSLLWSARRCVADASPMRRRCALNNARDTLLSRYSGARFLLFSVSELDGTCLMAKRDNVSVIVSSRLGSSSFQSETFQSSGRSRR
jgi:hypothetical protein